ncbi:TetR/AcrR family transcriptional regulator [Nocardia nova]|jgi:TetR/AcrR family transcriptional repressor of nem operon|uniref:TetR/AcrR family transcriptional regulator n=1 Tax=Nocardia TaxID=1817 RepID=UPI0009ED704F|nr:MULTISPECIES: TetR/AcrR family transcriptional regulator [Nocardia]PPI98818.1 TetR/AcrR family transcriptional regulator [Nocardia nova]PPJ01835.1 TetR/AcrR family transcriptional regulator [Nocardia nova]
MGRPRQFDESALLDAATELFWSQGFEQTSVEDVSRASGIGNGSIYAAYRSKRGLFLAAFERYCEGRARLVREVVTSAPGSAQAAVRALFEAIIDDCVSQPDRRGCLMLNSIAQLGSRLPEVISIGNRTTAAMERGVAERLRRAAEESGAELDASTLAAYSATVVMTAQGLIQLSRLGTPLGRLRDIAEVSSRNLPEAWNVPVADRVR